MRHYEYFTGRVGQVRDLVELQNGNCVLNFSVAETPRIKDKSGQWVDGETIWTEISLFGDEARNFYRSASPGMFVTVIGTRSARSYVPSDSTEKRVIQQIVAEQVAISITKFQYVETVGNVNYAKEGRGGATKPPANANRKTQTKANEDPFASSGSFKDDDPFASSEDPFGIM